MNLLATEICCTLGLPGEGGVTLTCIERHVVALKIKKNVKGND